MKKQLLGRQNLKNVSAFLAILVIENALAFFVVIPFLESWYQSKITMSFVEIEPWNFSNEEIIDNDLYYLNSNNLHVLMLQKDWKPTGESPESTYGLDIIEAWRLNKNIYQIVVENDGNEIARNLEIRIGTADDLTLPDTDTRLDSKCGILEHSKGCIIKIPALGLGEQIAFLANSNGSVIRDIEVRVEGKLADFTNSIYKQKIAVINPKSPPEILIGNKLMIYPSSSESLFRLDPEAGEWVELEKRRKD